MPADPTIPRCEIIEPLLSPYLDDELTPTETALVQAHVAVCERCASELAFLRLTHAVLSNPTEVPVPAQLSARIAAATYARPTLRQRLSEWLRPAPVRVAALGTAAAFTVGVIAASVLLRGGPPVGTVSAPPVAQPAPEPAVSPGPTLSPPETVAPRGRTEAARKPSAPVTSPRPSNAPALDRTPRKSPSVPEPQTQVAVVETSEKPAKPDKKPGAAEVKVSPVPSNPARDSRNNPASVASLPPPLSPREVPQPSLTPRAAVSFNSPAPGPPPAPAPTPVPEPTPRAVAALNKDDIIRIPISSSRESAGVARVIHLPVSGARRVAIRPGSFEEPGQPLEADVSFVTAPVQ